MDNKFKNRIKKIDDQIVLLTEKIETLKRDRTQLIQSVFSDLAANADLSMLDNIQQFLTEKNTQTVSKKSKRVECKSESISAAKNTAESAAVDSDVESV